MHACAPDSYDCKCYVFNITTSCMFPYKLMRHNLFYLDANNYISSCLTVWLTCEKCRRVKNSKHSHLEHKSLYDLFGV